MQRSAPNAAAPTAAPPVATAGRHVLVLYKFDTCPYCIHVMRTIQALGLADAVTYRDTRRDPSARAELRELTGGSQVPCLLVDGEPMLESADIVRWLRGEYGS